MTSDEKYIITTFVDTIIITDIKTGTRIAKLEGVMRKLTILVSFAQYKLCGSSFTKY
jgi:hypothetical protein